MSAMPLVYATIRYRNAGLCDESQRSTLAATLEPNATSIAALDRAVRDGAPITLAQYDALVDRHLSISDRARYGIAFGRLDPRINDFAMMADEVAEVTARALSRGTPMTDAEIFWLERNVEYGLDILY